jgi:hypothetical protein
MEKKLIEFVGSYDLQRGYKIYEYKASNICYTALGLPYQHAAAARVCGSTFQGYCI